MESVLPFAETRCLITSRDGLTFPLAVRAIPDDAQRRDPGMMGALDIEAATRTRPRGAATEGSSSGPSWRATSSCARLRGGLLVVSAGGEEGVEARTVKVRVGGTFRSGYYDFDFGMAILPFSSGAGASIFPPSELVEDCSTGSSSRTCTPTPVLPRGFETILASARIGSRAGAITTGLFFGALRTEKTVMMLLIGLIFLVVGVNIFHSMRRAVAERDRGYRRLEGDGSRPLGAQARFILDGLVIGAGGAIVGLILGLLVAMNVNEVFALVEAVVNAVAGLAYRMLGTSAEADFRVFSPQYFYLLEVPVRVLFPETFFVTAGAIASAAGAAASAASRISDLAPAEVLRYE